MITMAYSNGKIEDRKDDKKWREAIARWRRRSFSGCGDDQPLPLGSLPPHEFIEWNDVPFIWPVIQLHKKNGKNQSAKGEAALASPWWRKLDSDRGVNVNGRGRGSAAAAAAWGGKWKGFWWLLPRDGKKRGGEKEWFGEHTSSFELIEEIVNSWQRVPVFDHEFVQLTVIDTHSHASVLLFHK